MRLCRRDAAWDLAQLYGHSMTLINPVGFAQIVHLFSLAGDPEQMMTTYGVDIAQRGSSAADVAGDERDRFIAAYPVAGRSADYTYQGVKAYIGQGAGAPIISEAPAASAGTNAMSCPPQNCAVLVRKQSAQGGRAHRGRMFWPPFGLAESNVGNNGQLVADFVEDFQTTMDALATDFGLVILHDSTTPGNLQPTVVTNLVVDSRIATQRRRLR